MLRWLLMMTVVALLGGCRLVFPTPIKWGVPISTSRFEVHRLNSSQLSPDQRALVAQAGKPDIIVVEEELKTNKPVQRWIYKRDKTIYSFLDGRKVDYVQVDTKGRNPMLEEQEDQGLLVSLWHWIQQAAYRLRG